MASPKRLYKGRGTKARQLRSFKARYGKRGAAVYGAVIGKVAREQARLRGRKVERVRAHPSHSRTGRPERVRSHVAVLYPSPLWPRGAYVTRVRKGWVKAHWSHTKTGTPVWVKGHSIRAHRAVVEMD